MYLILFSLFCEVGSRYIPVTLPYLLYLSLSRKVERLSSYDVGLIVENNWDVIYIY